MRSSANPSKTLALVKRTWGLGFSSAAHALYERNNVSVKQAITHVAMTLSAARIFG
jgi:hypothetical protein